MKLIFVTFAFLIANFSFSQKKWTLSECLNYAVQNNISVKKTQLNEQTAQINHHQSKNNRLPNIGGVISGNMNHGSAINQITYRRESQTTYTNSIGV